ERGLLAPGARLGEPQTDPAIAPETQEIAAPARHPSEIRDAHDRELQTLGSVDRHQPDGVQSLALDRRLTLANVTGAGPPFGPALGPGRRRGRRTRRRSAPAAASCSRPSRISLRTFASRRAPPGSASIARS